MHLKVTEWYDRATKFNELTSRINKLATKINDIPNRELLYEVYPYIWDIRGVVSMLNSYVKWLGKHQDFVLINNLQMIICVFLPSFNSC